MTNLPTVSTPTAAPGILNRDNGEGVWTSYSTQTVRSGTTYLLFDGESTREHTVWIGTGVDISTQAVIISTAAWVAKPQTLQRTTGVEKTLVQGYSDHIDTITRLETSVKLLILVPSETTMRTSTIIANTPPRKSSPAGSTEHGGHRHESHLALKAALPICLLVLLAAVLALFWCRRRQFTKTRVRREKHVHSSAAVESEKTHPLEGIEAYQWQPPQEVEAPDARVPAYLWSSDGKAELSSDTQPNELGSNVPSTFVPQKAEGQETSKGNRDVVPEPDRGSQTGFTETQQNAQTVESRHEVATSPSLPSEQGKVHHEDSISKVPGGWVS
ncbi:hypothetical protein LTR37_011321 [Vermiconidia calcicola]|uniref:Uncharacterized protein n=1 Tax=Vermiconidia calcicola TaxID=1690605 RepID=A0ACC3N2X3_9PEZI|nr:hypothetical protein LTR37_011321 [Vermiconidia calcicola]